MALTIHPVTQDEKEILRNLLEKYLFEFSQWTQQDVNPLGLFGYSYLDYYWTAPNRWAYFARVDGRIAGFAMVNDYPELARKTDYSLAEFCMLPKYRRAGLGKAFALEIMKIHRGTWQLRRHPKNLPSVGLWDAVAHAASAAPVEIVTCEASAYEDGTLGEVLYFDSLGL